MTGRQSASAPARRRPAPLPLLFAALTLLLFVGALLAPFNHDEAQYYGAGLALRSGMLYRDFIYLQTPLNAWLGAPVIALAPGHGLVALRLLTALMGAALLAILAATLRRLYPEHPRKAVLLGLATIGTCYSFLFAATVYRNDMLPALLEGGALALLMRLCPPASPMPQGDGGTGANRQRGRDAAILLGAGLLLGLAASTKINYAILPAAPGLWLLLRTGKPFARRIAEAALMSGGFLIGILPSLYMAALAPEAFWWQVVHFGAQAPLDWYRGIGDGIRLTPAGRALDILVILVQGPMLVALLLVLRARITAQRTGTRPPAHRQRDALLDLFLLIAFVAAAVPTPAWRQYFLVLLPPLALRLPGMLEGLTGRSRRAAGIAFGVTAAVGVISWAVPLAGTLLTPHRAIFSRAAEAHWIGARLRAAETRTAGPASPMVATLSPDLVVDSGAALDPRFASGVFVWRWTSPQEQAAISAMHGLTPLSAASGLAAAPPDAIVTGYEGRAGASFAVDLEEPLRRFAEQHGYRRIASPIGKASLYIRPRATHPEPGDIAPAR